LQTSEAGAKSVIKAACHVHSEWSYDGKWSLDKLVREFGRRGYRALLMTEHDRGFTQDRLLEYRDVCAQRSSDQVLVVPGIEYSDAENMVHVLVWGPLPFLGEGRSTSELLPKVRQYNGLAVLAHPSRRNAWQLFDPAWSVDLLGIEMWNRKTDGWAPSRTAPDLLKNKNLLPFVGLDFHTRRQCFPLSLELNLAEGITEESVLNALRSYQFCPKVLDIDVRKLLCPSAGNLVFSSLEKVRKVIARSTRALLLNH
jgi:hypothetical protein